jgi:thymidine phosphorylase
MVVALGGPADLVERPWDHLDRAPITRDVPALRSGTVARIDTRHVGLAVVVLGGGRTRPQDAVDHAVGLTGLAGVGAKLSEGGSIGTIHARTEAAADQATTMLQAAYTFGDETPAPTHVVRERVVLGD